MKTHLISMDQKTGNVELIKLDTRKVVQKFYSMCGECSALMQAYNYCELNKIEYM